MKTRVFEYQFVDLMPMNIEKGIFYISIPYKIAKHQCACGCGKIIDLIIDEDFWSITFHGNSISVYPSIGNWNIPCKSHYFIRKSKVVWSYSHKIFLKKSR